MTRDELWLPTGSATKPSGVVPMLLPSTKISAHGDAFTNNTPPGNATLTRADLPINRHRSRQTYLDAVVNELHWRRPAGSINGAPPDTPRI